MSNSKKAILSAVSVVCIISILSFVLTFFLPHEDAAKRKELAGSLDFLIVGASQAQNCFIPEEIDKGLNVNSYNLSIGSMTATDKIIMIKKECSRNPVKTIVLEVSIGAMRRPVKNNAADGNFHMFNRLDTFSEKADYLLKHTPFDNWAYIYARSVITSAYSILDGSFKNNASDKNKGYVPDPVNDFSLKNDKIVEEYGSKPFSLNDYYESSIQEFEDTIDYCKSLGVRLIVAVVPVSDGYLWKIKNADEFGNWINDFCRKKEIECYNFNLAKNRYALFNDSESYGASEDHMSHVGAENFTRLFVQTINQIDSGANASDLFYGSYSEMMKDSPYMKYYKNSEGKK